VFDLSMAQMNCMFKSCSAALEKNSRTLNTVNMHPYSSASITRCMRVYAVMPLHLIIAALIVG
jgi:hypothetical protein